MEELNIQWTETKKVLEEIGDKVIAQYQSNLEMNRHMATGKLADVKKIVKFEDYELEVDLELEHYWYWIENGRQPGGHFSRAFIDSISEWIRVKHIVPEVRNGKKAPSVEQLPWAIAGGIIKNGYEPIGHPLQNAIDSLENTFEDRLGEAMATDITNAINAGHFI